MYKFIRFARGIGLGRVVCLVLLAALVLLRIWDPGPLKALRLRAFDYYQQITYTGKRSPFFLHLKYGAD